MQAPPPSDGGATDFFAEDEAPIFAEINVTPLTDVFLVLLIIFMVVASSAIDQKEQASRVEGRLSERALEVTTPQGSGSSSFVARDIVISVLPDGTLFVDEQEVALAELTGVLRQKRTESQSKRVIVRGDETAQYKLIIRVISAARSAGLQDVALATRPGG